MKKKRPLSRPRREHVVNVRMGEDELTCIASAARRQGLAVATWIRLTALTSSGCAEVTT